MNDWREMYCFPYAPHDRAILGLATDGREIECRYHPIRQQWIDGEGRAVAITHWQELTPALGGNPSDIDGQPDH